MSITPFASPEQQRLAALKAYKILDTATEQDYDELTELAAAICQTPIALISLVDQDRQWFKSRKGLDVTETERSQSFCAHAIQQPTELMQVEDANIDERFKDNPLVTGDPHITFYAGMPLVDDEGHALGSLCVIDNKPRRLDEAQQRALKVLARQVVGKLNLRKKVIDLEMAHTDNAALHTKSRESEHNLRRIIEQSPAAIIVFRGANLMIDAANPAMLTLLDQEAGIVGQPLLQAIPELDGQPAYHLLTEIYKTGEPVYGYDTPVQLKRNGQIETGYFNFTYTPLIEDGHVVGIIDMAIEVTEQVKARKAIEQSEHRLRQMVMSAPMGMCILKGHDLVIEIANEPMLKIWTRKADEVLGKRLTDVFPEVKGQPFPAMLRKVLDTGEPLAIPELSADIAETDGTINRVYIDFTYDPLLDADGKPEAIMATVINITETVKARKLLEASENQLQNANEELTTVNEEQSAANEELAALNEELISTNEQLQLAHTLLLETELKLNLAIGGAQLGLWTLDFADNRLELNTEYRNMFGLPLNGEVSLDAIMQIVDPAYITLLQQAISDGIQYQRDADLLYPIRHGVTGQRRWIKARGRVQQDESKTPVRFIGINIDVTREIDAIERAEALHQTLANTHAKLAEQEENLRLAVSSANLGTWYMNMKTHEFVPSNRLKELFGYHVDELMPYSAASEQIEESHRDRVKQVIEVAINNRQEYDLEYPIIGYHDKKLRWVRATGKIFEAHGSSPEHFSGTIADITERKQEEQRKMDFIGIVSHELRSPLTALNGYVQVLALKGKKTEDQAVLDLTAKAKRQVDKMSSMITGFLDVARMGESQIQLKRTAFDMAALVKQAEDESLATITTHKVVFAPVEYTPVNADQDKIEQVLINFINNAVKYSPPGSTICVACITRGGRAHVNVADEGMGISPKDLPFVFNRFFRVESESMKSVKGFGIGLYLCKDIIERHGGKIGVESVLHKGSSFWFDLPVAL